MWSQGVGADVMKPDRRANHRRDGTSTIHVLIIAPVVFDVMKRRALRRGVLMKSGTTI